MTDVTLQHCPFCGSDDVRNVHGIDDRTRFVSCGKCHAMVQGWGDTPITLWNTRVPDPAAQARIDAAMTFLREKAATEEWADKALVVLAQILLEPPKPNEADIQWGAETIAALRGAGLWPTT